MSMRRGVEVREGERREGEVEALKCERYVSMLVA